jgi:glycosyltransferase involved in cell wall biosynthesis
MLGAIERYKGIEDALLYWQKSAPPCALHIVGAPAEAAYLAELQHLAAGHPLIHFTPRWQSDDDLAAWLAAADAVLFNYRRILTSGAAVLARACGVPVLLPERLDVIDLAEPDDRVVRFAGFDADFLPHLDKVLQTGSDFAAARAFRETTAWSRVAAITADLYRSLLPPT